MAPDLRSGSDKGYSLIRHDEYYFEDGTLIIQVGQVLFNVFRSTFTRHSRVFRDIFSLPKQSVPAVHEADEGSSDFHPVQLPGISSTDFERLLWVLYPPKYGSYRAQTAKEWTSILHLATRWEFDDIRALAIRQLEHCKSLSAIDKIVISREYDIDSAWTLQAYTELCERAEAISVQEAMTLGLPTAIRISQLRESFRKKAAKSRPSIVPKANRRQSTDTYSPPPPSASSHSRMLSNSQQSSLRGGRESRAAGSYVASPTIPPSRSRTPGPPPTPRSASRQGTARIAEKVEKPTGDLSSPTSSRMIADAFGLT